MSEYIKTIILTVLAVSVASCLLPKNSFGKFGNVIASIIVVTVLLMPVKSGVKISLKELDIKELSELENTYLKSRLEEDLEKRLCDELKEKTNREFSASVSVSIEGEEIFVEKVAIFPYSKEYAAIASSYLGTEEDKIFQK